MLYTKPEINQKLFHSTSYQSEQCSVRYEKIFTGKLMSLCRLSMPEMLISLGWRKNIEIKIVCPWSLLIGYLTQYWTQIVSLNSRVETLL